ncbi:MAG: glutathione S-transferase family protein [Gammaproteobacteria bacterium]|nr:glutathione S-transferase family protein [Gammaproteobacteria bacterium]
MLLYDFKLAPNPRRVRMYLAEKNIEVPTEQVNLREKEQFNDEFRAVNPDCVVPCLKLDDGRTLTESMAICRYFEALHPEPPLFGRDPYEQAVVEMWSRRAELEGFFAVAEVLRNSSPFFEGRSVPGPVPHPQVPDLVERGTARFKQFTGELEKRLADSEFLAGAHFSVADITAAITVDFASWVKLGLADDQPNAGRWFAAMQARPSFAA